MPSVQKKIRDLERLIVKIGDPTADLARRLAILKEEKAQHEKNEHDRKMCDKYHKVKFIERKKITRKLRAIDSQIAGRTPSLESSENLTEKRQQLLDDLKYVMYYPKGLKYVGLLNEDNGDEKSIKKSNALRARARHLASQNYEKCLEEGGKNLVEHAIKVEYEGGDIKLVNSGRDLERSFKKRNSHSAGVGAFDDIERTSVVKGGQQFETEVECSSPQRESAEEENLNSPKNTESFGGKEHRRNKRSKVESRDDAASKVTKVAEVDQFFLEEANDDDAAALAATITDAKIPVGGLRSVGRQGNTGQRRSRIVDDGSYTKQELRLLQWQEKVRGKKAAF